MENEVLINGIRKEKNKIYYEYTIKGPWKEAFSDKDKFNIEYSFDIGEIPDSILIVPFLANLLPVAWIYNAEIKAPCCDKDFYNSIKEFKEGYKEMYPMIKFGGKLSVNNIIETKQKGNGSIVFFSGGVDSFSTLVNHIDEKPMLITVWGADIRPDNLGAWTKVSKHLQKTAVDFGLDYSKIRSNFRCFIKNSVLLQKVKNSGDNWWHGFQHGIGVICLAAPASYFFGKNMIYFASTYSKNDNHKVTCASYPTIDNHVRFGGSKVFHDGFEYDRQMKICNIITYCKNHNKKIDLRVCWRSTDGRNCCQCEKCWRTILGIYAEGADPNDFGFNYSYKELKQISKKMRYLDVEIPINIRRYYTVIQDVMNKNVSISDLPKPIRWTYKLNAYDIYKKGSEHRLLYKIMRVINRVL